MISEFRERRCGAGCGRRGSGCLALNASASSNLGIAASMSVSWSRSTARSTAGSRIVQLACTLLVFVDDATSRLMELRFVASESTFAYFEALKAYLHRHGKPVAFYSDKHSIFRVSNENAASGNGMTQFGRALSELNIEILCANTSQAKGRVERAHHTLQDRLVKELRLAGISTIEAANAFLPSFVANYNGRFAKPAARDQDFHRSVDPRQDLDQILCWREQRQVSHQLVVNYSRMKLTLKPEGLAVRLRGKMVEIYDFPDGRLEVRWKGRSLPYSAFDKLQRVSHAAIVENKRLGEILAWIKEQQDRQPRFNRVPDGPRRSSQKPGILKNPRHANRPRPPNRSRKRPAEAGAAPIWWSPRRRLTLPARPPSDISTLQNPRHLYFVATSTLASSPLKMARQREPAGPPLGDFRNGKRLGARKRGASYRRPLF